MNNKYDDMLEDSFPGSDPLPAQMDDPDQLAPNPLLQELNKDEIAAMRDPSRVVVDLMSAVHHSIQQKDGQLPHLILVSPQAMNRLEQWQENLGMSNKKLNVVTTPYGVFPIKEDRNVTYIEVRFTDGDPTGA